MKTGDIMKGLNSNTFQRLSVLSILIIMCIIFGLSSKVFFSTENLLTVALQTVIIAIIAIGQTFVIITTGIDLSIGSTIALSGIITSMLLVAKVPVFFSIMVGLLVGIIIGFINGLVIVYGKVPPFIVTLGTMSIVRGIALVLTNGIPITNLPPGFTVIGSGRVLGIPIPVYIMIVLALVFGFILSKTKLGRYNYAIGSNFEAARLSGIDTNKVLISIYSISGFLAACAGIILTARIVSGQPTAGTGYELDAVAASVIGGASLLGGEGTVLGAVIGAFVIGVLRNGLNLLNVSAFWQQIAIGIVIIAAVYFDGLRRNKLS
ncbi:ABC transporter permease [Thermosediminibacter oceani]|uniref:Monosaccharide ABC transporter membrane protein, CUT2 family n=1 Tax=Thermosediminibacter oceani (strain ATCC BAA-1034 / DSM 16646 / JW/IW-1228P) TaxID=555079 RepID=D9RZ48_THEOJ|nr:ABC transporter permease [Thermosediminibacter oceani]ADL08602.1 monosaccharide ABC transporter membrane protein, CUT2 family [Thermosediminibacter oceani DSM 16646]